MIERIHHITAEDLGAYLEGNLGEDDNALMAQLLDDSDVLRDLAADAEGLDIEWDAEPDGDMPDMDWLDDLDTQILSPEHDADFDDLDFDAPDEDLFDLDLDNG